MPCYDNRDDDSDNEKSSLKQRMRDLQDELEPLLCEACTLLTDNHLIEKTSPQLKKWYGEHIVSEIDRRRLEVALKLSESERQILGIDLAALKRKTQKKCEK
jgi:hypothetical protein